jgi:hypothetical protein
MVLPRNLRSCNAEPVLPGTCEAVTLSMFCPEPAKQVAE